MGLGICIFLLGLFKKVCIADHMAFIADPVYSRALAGISPDPVAAWVGTLAYSFQIYFDFSAYSDMAFGLGLLCGVRLPVNFYSPYQATCINEFWRRWNITLGAFFRDYLYIPLGGGRVAPAWVAFNVVLVMFLSGLWHGAGWNFVLWGLLHGLGMSLATGWGRLRGQRLNTGHPVYRMLSISLTFAFVTLAWVLFRSADIETALRMYGAMFSLSSLDLAGSLPAAPLQRLGWLLLLPILALVMMAPNVLAWLGVQRDGTLALELNQISTPRLAAIGVLGAAAIVVLVNGRSENFLYFIF